MFKKIKLLILGIIALSTIVSCSKENTTNENPMSKSGNSEFDKFFTSDEFNQLSKTFNITRDQIDQKNFYSEKSKENNLILYRTTVNQNGIISFLNICPYKNGKKYMVIFEQNKLNEEQTKGYFVHYSETGLYYADFKVNKLANKIYNFKINNVRINGSLDKTLLQQPYGECVTGVYRKMKEACESNERCDFICDMTPGCNTSMAISAAIYCLDKDSHS